VRGLGLQFRVATGEGGDLGIGLLEAGRYALRAAGRLQRRGVEAVRVQNLRRSTDGTARIAQRRAELRQAKEFAQVWRAEARRIRCTHRNRFDRLPTEAEFAGGFATERRVVGPT